MPKDNSAAEYERILSSSLSRTIDFLRFAEAKNAALLTLASAWSLAITTILMTNRAMGPLDTGLLSIARCLLVAAALVAMYSFLPKLRPETFHKDPGKPKNLLFFGDIALFEFEAFRTRLRNDYRIDGNPNAGERYLDDLEAQIWINSRIARQKMVAFNYAAIASFGGIVPALFPTVVAALRLIRSMS